MPSKPLNNQDRLWALLIGCVLCVLGIGLIYAYIFLYIFLVVPNPIVSSFMVSFTRFVIGGTVVFAFLFGGLALFEGITGRKIG